MFTVCLICHVPYTRVKNFTISVDLIAQHVHTLSQTARLPTEERIIFEELIFFIKCPKWPHPNINILISIIKPYTQFHEFLNFEIGFFAHLHILSADCQSVDVSMNFTSYYE